MDTLTNAPSHSSIKFVPQSGELTRLQLLLCAIPEIRDDEECLKRMRAIFLSYTANESMDLEEAAFVAFLMEAGGSWFHWVIILILMTHGMSPVHIFRLGQV